MRKTFSVVLAALAVIGGTATAASAGNTWSAQGEGTATVQFVPFEGLDVPALFGMTRSGTSVIVRTTIKSDSPGSTVNRVLHTRGGTTLSNTAANGTSVVRTVKNVRAGDYLTVTAKDMHGHVDREARRIAS